KEDRSCYRRGPSTRPGRPGRRRCTKIRHQARCRSSHPSRTPSAPLPPSRLPTLFPDPTLPPGPLRRHPFVLALARVMKPVEVNTAPDAPPLIPALGILKALLPDRALETDRLRGPG